MAITITIRPHEILGALLLGQHQIHLVHPLAVALIHTATESRIVRIGGKAHRPSSFITASAALSGRSNGFFSGGPRQARSLPVNFGFVAG
jgi:hypothetical protein